NRNVVDDRIQELLGLVQLLFGAALLGDVLVGRDPAAAGERLTGYADQRSVGMFVDPARSFFGRQRRQSRQSLLHVGVAVTALQDAAADTVSNDVAARRHGVGPLRRQ